jgi:4'-phosphopantetheinyl transferase
MTQPLRIEVNAGDLSGWNVKLGAPYDVPRVVTAATIDIWMVSTGDATPDEFQSHLRTLSDDERARARGYVRPPDAMAFAKTRSVLRRLIAERLGVRPDEVRFTYDRLGRPHLPPETPLGFSVSHSAPYNVIAIAEAHNVGIDIEKWEPMDVAEMGFGVFAPEELDRIRTAPNRLKSLYDHWTRKEAVLKLQGVGLGGSPESLSMTPEAPQWFGRACVQNIPVPDGVSAALAVECVNVRDLAQFTLRSI